MTISSKFLLSNNRILALKKLNSLRYVRVEQYTVFYSSDCLVIKTKFGFGRETILHKKLTRLLIEHLPQKGRGWFC